MRSFITMKTILYLLVYLAFFPFCLMGQVPDNQAPKEYNMLTIGAKVSQGRLMNAPSGLVQAVKQQLKEMNESPASITVPAYSNDLETSRVMLGGYAVHIIGSSGCALPTANNVFGFEIGDLCRQTTYSSPFTSAGFDGSGKTMSVYCGDWIGDRWLVFTTIKESGQTYLGYWMTFDPITRDVDIIDMANPDMQCLDMAYDVTASKMYGMGLEQELYRFNTTDKGSTFIGLIRKNGEPFERRFMALACNNQGVLFAINVDKNLYRIDKTTGAATLVGSLKLDNRAISPDNLQSAAFDLRTNTLYFALRGTAFHELYTINTTTGEASLAGNMYVETAGLFHHYYTSKNVPPEMVTSFKATIGDNPLKVKLSWKNPERNFNGAPLPDLDSIYIYRGTTGYALSPFAKMKAATAGEEMSYEVEESVTGTYYYGCMAVTKSGKTSLLAGGAAYCFESGIPYKMGFEKNDNYMPLTVPVSGWRIDTLAANYPHTGVGAIVTTNTSGGKILINALKAQKGAAYQLDLWGLAPSVSGARFTIDLGNRKGFSTASIPRQASPFTQFSVTGIAESEMLPVSVQCTSNGIWLDDISIKMLYPGTTPDSVKSPVAKISEKGKHEVKISWTNPTLDAGGNPLKCLSGVIIQKTSTGGAFTTGVTADTIPTTDPGKEMSAIIAVPASNNYYFRIIPVNEDGPCPYPYDLGKVGFVGNDTVPASPRALKAVPVPGGRAAISWEEVTSGRYDGYLNGSITGYEVRLTTYDTKVLLNDTVVVSGREYTTGILPPGIYCAGVKAIRNNNRKNTGLEALVYVTVGTGENQILIAGDFNKKPDSNTHPLYIAYGSKSAVAQCTYTKEEIGGKCVIDTLVFYLYAPSTKAAFKQEMTVYLGYRTSDVFANTTDWTSILDDETQMVFSDSLQIPLNQQLIKIPVKPFYYDGKRNLMLTTVKKDLIAPPNTFSCSFIGINGETNRAILKRTATAIEKLEDVAAETLGVGELTKFIPTLTINRMANLAAVKGLVTDKETGKPVENVRIAFIPKKGQDHVISTYIRNDSITGKYDFAYLPSGVYTVSLSKLGYKEKVSSEFEVMPDQAYPMDFAMETSLNVVMKGKLVNPKNQALSGVRIKAEGLLNYETVTQLDGTFEIKKVLSDNTYKMNFSKEGFVTATDTWVLAAGDTTFAPVVMPYIPYPVAKINATTTREVATIKIGKPAIMREATWATDTIAKKVGGSREKMIAAIEFYPSDIEKFELENKELVMVKFYANDPTANYVVHIYENECAALIYSQDVGNSLSGWQNVLLNTKYTVDSQKEFSIGVEAMPGYTGAPFALDLGPKTFKGDKVWFDGDWTRISKLISTYDSNWQIKGVFGQELDEDAAGGYQIYRLAEKDVNTPDKWLKITGLSIPSVTDGYKDYTWANTEAGVYKYAVKADWMNGNFSGVTFSNNLYRGMDSSVRFKVNTNGASKKEASVTFTNIDGLASHTYRQLSGEDGLVEFPAVWNGAYMLDVELASHPSIRKNIDVKNDTIIEGEIMREYISDPQLLSATVNRDAVRIDWTMKYPANWQDDFESYENFAVNGYGNYILDGKEPKYTMVGSEWINNSVDQSFIVFNPYATTPPVESYLYTPHSGNKELVAFAARTRENKDFIARSVSRGGGVFSFYARGIGYGGAKEKFIAMYSPAEAKISDFVMLSDSTIWATSNWVKYDFNVPSDAKYVGVKCVSKDLQAFLVDDMKYIAVNEGTPLFYFVFVDGAKKDEIIDADATTYLFEGLTNGKHTLGLKAMFASGASGMVTTAITIMVSDIKESASETIRLYPNPSTNGIFHLSASCDFDLEVLAFDGRMIRQTRLEKGNVQIDLSAEPAGCYLFRLTNDKETLTLKALK